MESSAILTVKENGNHCRLVAQHQFRREGGPVGVGDFTETKVGGCRDRPGGKKDQGGAIIECISRELLGSYVATLRLPRSGKIDR